MISKTCALLAAAAVAAHGQASRTPGTPRTPMDDPASSELSASKVDVPLIKSGDFYFVDVEVNGRPSRFTLETGANFFAMGERLAQRLGLRIDTVTGPSGRPIAVADLSTLRFGGATLSGVRAQVLPMFNDPTFAGEGIISLAALRSFVSTIDFPNKRLRLERRALADANGRDILSISGRDPGGRVDIPIEVGGVALPAVIDTRSYIGLMLPDSLASRIALVAPPRSLGSAAGPTLGAFRLQAARATGPMRIGEVRVDRPVLTFRNRPGVVIGMPILEQLVMTIDQRNRRVRIVPAGTNPIVMAAQPWESPSTSAAGTAAPDPRRAEGSPPPTPGSGQRTMGFNLAGFPGGGLSVRNVVAGSSADRAGIKEGDELVEFDGTAAANMNSTVFRAAAARGAPVKVVVTRDGKRLEFTVEPYLIP